MLHFTPKSPYNEGRGEKENMNKTQERIMQMLRRREALKYLEIGYPQTLEEAKKVGAFNIETNEDRTIHSYRLPKGWENVIIDEFIENVETDIFIREEIEAAGGEVISFSLFEGHFDEDYFDFYVFGEEKQRTSEKGKQKELLDENELIHEVFEKTQKMVKEGRTNTEIHEEMQIRTVVQVLSDLTIETAIEKSEGGANET